MASYKEVLKSSGIVASVQIFQLGFGLIRNKFIAYLLGSTGFGIWGLYQTYVELASNFSTLGVDQSGVREIANPDVVRKDKFISSFNKIILLISLLFFTITAYFSDYISYSMFKTSDRSLEIKIVSIAVILNSISRGQKSILNGLRNIKYLAISQIYAAITGTILTIISVWIFGLNALVWGIFSISLTALLFSWIYVNKGNIKSSTSTLSEDFILFKKLLYVGLGFSVSGLISSLATYFSRIYLSSEFSLSAVGIYQASWTISNLYIGIILAAMGVDFMPRLMKVKNDNVAMTKIVNEQMEFGALVSSIGVVGIIYFSPLVLELLYAKEFIIGQNIIHWQVLGVSLRILGFPFSYSIMAKNKPVLYIIVQAVFWLTDYGLLIFFSKWMGFDGLGINYFFSYLIYLVLTWTIAVKIFEFKSSALLRKITFISYLFIGISWILAITLDGISHQICGVITILIMLYWINIYLSKYMGITISKFLISKFKK